VSHRYPITDGELTEDVEDLPLQRAARLLQLVEERLIDLALARLGGDEVPQVTDLWLADAMDAAEALLEPIGVPREVVVDHQVRALESDALSGGVGGDEDLDIGVVQEGLLDFPSLVAVDAAMDDDDRLLATEERRDALFEVVQRVRCSVKMTSL
jgi:hypothetical protein